MGMSANFTGGIFGKGVNCGRVITGSCCCAETADEVNNIRAKRKIGFILAFFYIMLLSLKLHKSIDQTPYIISFGLSRVIILFFKKPLKHPFLQTTGGV
jgi:hypothetical protein